MDELSSAQLWMSLHVDELTCYHLHNTIQNFKLKRLAMINKDRMSFQYNSRDLVYILSPLTSQLRTASRKVMIKYVGPVAVYKIIDPHNYLLMTLGGKIL